MRGVLAFVDLHARQGIHAARLRKLAYETGQSDGFHTQAVANIAAARVDTLCWIVECLRFIMHKLGCDIVLLTTRLNSAKQFPEPD